MAFNETQNSNGSTSFVDSVSARIALTLRQEQGVDNGLATYVRFSDDFLGDVIGDQWSAAQGDDAQGAIAAVVAGAAGGVVRLTSGDAGDTTDHDMSSLTHALNWKASQGGVYLRTRLKINTAVTNVCLNIGFTDTLATVGLEMPITLSVATLTTNASDAAVFVYDTAATTDIFYCQGVKGNTDTALLASTGSIVPVADTYAIYEVYIDASGTATFLINGVLVGSVANAVTTSVALTPIVGVTARTTTSKVVDIDYIEVCALRA